MARNAGRGFDLQDEFGGKRCFAEQPTAYDRLPLAQQLTKGGLRAYRPNRPGQCRVLFVVKCHGHCITSLRYASQRQIDISSNGVSLDTTNMTLGARIESRLEAVGLSQAELARRVGVRQSTMNSLIRGNSRTSRSIVQIARELETTPAYLLGETDDPTADVPDDNLVRAERELLTMFRSLAGDERSAISLIVRRLAACAEDSDLPRGVAVRHRTRAIALHDEPHTYKAQA